MTLLCFSNGESFATGAISYGYRPATKTESTNRIFLRVEIQGIPTQAVVDTGAPYVIVRQTLHPMRELILHRH